MYSSIHVFRQRTDTVVAATGQQYPTRTYEYLRYLSVDQTNDSNIHSNMPSSAHLPLVNY